MKCPNCDFIDKDEAFGDPAICPKCGAIYKKALRVRRLRDQLDAQKAAKKPAESTSEAPIGRLANAANAVAEGRKAREVAAKNRAEKRERQMVIVTDIDMPFWSMVSFMIKWAIASVPAILILMLIVVGVPSFFGALAALFFR